MTSTTYANFSGAPTTDNSLAYDPNGNRTSGSAASSTNRVLFDGTYYYTYDATGNRVLQYENDVTNQPDSDATDVTTFAWNNANQLVAVKHYADGGDYGSHSPDWQVDYGVDAFGRIVSRTPTDITGESAENYVYDGANLAIVLNSDGQVTERELYAPAVDAIMASEAVATVESGTQSAGTVNWTLGDNQGTIRDVVQGVLSDGTMTASLVDHVIFDAYGNATQGADFTGNPLPRFGLNGMRRDAATGLSLSATRPYDPGTGDWLQPDRTGLGSDTNPARFCGNSPTNNVDPTGESWYPWRWPGEVIDYLGNSAGDISQGVVDHIDLHSQPTDQFAMQNNSFSMAADLSKETGVDLRYGASTRRGATVVYPGYHKEVIGDSWADQQEIWVPDDPGVGLQRTPSGGGGGTPKEGAPAYLQVYEPASAHDIGKVITVGEINWLLAGPQLSLKAANGLGGMFEGSEAATWSLQGLWKRVWNNCFAAGTLVGTPRGKFPIESLEAGDEVWAYDLVNSRWCPRPILETYVSDYDGVSTTITVADEKIDATFLHPFWVVSGDDLSDRPIREHLPPVPEGATASGRWVDAGDIRVGDELLLRDGRVLPVQAIRHQSYRGKVYNFHVDDLQCYAVGVADILVHNNSRVLGRSLAANVRARAAGEAAAHIVPSGNWASTNRLQIVKDAIANSQARVNSLLPGGINGYYNGFWTNDARQLGTHTDAYFITMWNLLQNAQSENEVVAALAELRQMAQGF